MLNNGWPYVLNLLLRTAPIESITASFKVIFWKCSTEFGCLYMKYELKSTALEYC